MHSQSGFNDAVAPPGRNMPQLMRVGVVNCLAGGAHPEDAMRGDGDGESPTRGRGAQVQPGLLHKH
eukprot:7153057-Alexandrium_andersonii.AAC.1